MNKQPEALKLAEQPAIKFTDKMSIDVPNQLLFQNQPAQPQEPVAWMDGYRNIYSLEEKAAGCEDAVIPLVPATLQHWSDCAVHNEPAYPAGKCDCGGYTSPPASKPLTDEQIEEMCKLADDDEDQSSWIRTFTRAIEAAHGIKE